MAIKEIRLQARKQARELLAHNKKARLEVEGRRDALAVTVMTSLGERDALVADAEEQAGAALAPLAAAAAPYGAAGVVIGPPHG
jgi:orotidine-5'-phosphate decarboxylase